MAGLALIGLVISLRKRVAAVKWGDFAHWRIVHSALGLAACALFLAHTGLHLGSNLNAWLGLCFVGVGVTGAASGIAVAREHLWPPRIARRARSAGQWAHVVFAWPLPALLAYHVVAFYYF
jgi:nitrite reductase (NADH) large subunit